jgi:uncharacterized membrane protein YqjE
MTMSVDAILSSIKNLGSTAVEMIQTRLELFSSDIQIGWQRLLSVLVLVIITLFSLLFGLVLLAILIVVLYWDSHRVLVLSLMTGGFLSIGILLALYVRAQINAMPRLFEASLGELAKDRDHLT